MRLLLHSSRSSAPYGSSRPSRSPMTREGRGSEPSAQVARGRTARLLATPLNAKGRVMKRSLRWTLLSVGLAGVVAAALVGPGAATPPSGLVNTPLARGTNSSDGTIPLQAGTDVVVATITVQPGG